MMFRTLIVLAALLSLSPCAFAQDERWAVYYGNAAKQADLLGSFDMVVLDADDHPPLNALKAQGKTLLGYVSLGEAETYRPYFKQLQKAGVLLAPNKEWKGHRIIDIRKPEWQSLVIDQLITNALAQGFDGVMLDTLDSPLDLEINKPQKYAGMKEAALKMLRDIRAHFPSAKIMVNRGFAAYPEAVHFIDYTLAESTRSGPAGKGFKRLSEKEYAAYVVMLKDAQSKNPALKIYTLDYWNMKERKGVARIYADQRTQGFIPYVATPDLQKIYPEAGK